MANTGQPTVFFSWVKATPYGDKVGHVFLFGLLTLGGNIALQFKRLKLGFTSIYTATAIVTVFVLLEEFSQAFVKTRTFDSQDLIADALGVILFTLLSYRIEKKSFSQRLQ